MSVAAERIFNKIMVRRLLIRSIGLSLEGFIRLGYEPDLFEPESEIANRRLQEAIDKIQGRYGMGKITKGLVLAASAIKGGRPLLTAAAQGYGN